MTSENSAKSEDAPNEDDAPAMVEVAPDWEMEDLEFETWPYAGEEWQVQGNPTTDGALGSEAPWVITSTPFERSIRDDKEAHYFIQLAKSETTQATRRRSIGRWLGRALTKIRSTFQPTLSPLQYPPGPDPYFAEKMEALRAESDTLTSEEPSATEQADLSEPAQEQYEEQAAPENPRTADSSGDEEQPNTSLFNQTRFLERTREWVRHRKLVLGLGAVALSTAALFVSAPSNDAPTQSFSPKIEALAAPQPGMGALDILSSARDADVLLETMPSTSGDVAASIETNGPAKESVVQTPASSDQPETAIFTIVKDGNLSWAVKDELRARGIQDEAALNRATVDVNALLQAQTDRNLERVYANEQFKVPEQVMRQIIDAALAA